MKNAQLATIIGLLFVVASLANGSVSYLKRVGLLEHGAYTRFVQTYCSGQEDTPCACMQEPPSGSVPNDFADEKYIYANNGNERLLKICKDLLFAGFFLLSCYLIQAKRANAPDSEALLPPLSLLASVGVGFLISLFLWGDVFALAGLRSFTFLAIALVGGWAFTGIQQITSCVAILLVMQLILVFIEAHIGLPLRDCPSSFRAAGTMVTPNSLGVLTVVGLAFYYVYSSAKTYFPFLLLVGTTILLASGSGTGIIALFVLVGVLCLTSTSGLRKLILAGALLIVSAGLLAKLPALLNRPDIYASVLSSGGRIGKFTEVLSEASPIEILVGRGIGFGTNTATNLHIGATSSADSMVTVLLMQLGMVGVILFYSLLIWAYRRDARARPVYLVFAITSLTINITEVFPVNFLLGLALAGTLSRFGRACEIKPHDQRIPEQVTWPPSARAPVGGKRFAGIARGCKQPDQ
jgi:hypothetical protein